MNRSAKFTIWDITMLCMGIISAVAGALLVAAWFWEMPIVSFFSQIVLLAFLPVVIIYVWTEKVVAWMNIDSKVLDAIALVLRILAIIMFILFAGSRILSMCRDIPYAATSNYYQVQGKPMRVATNSGARSKLYVAVNGIRFNVGAKTLEKINRNTSYNITYLPHSKYVISIRQDNRVAFAQGQ